VVLQQRSVVSLVVVVGAAKRQIELTRADTVYVAIHVVAVLLLGRKTKIFFHIFPLTQCVSNILAYSFVTISVSTNNRV
jgi:hypothetical protein